MECSRTWAQELIFFFFNDTATTEIYTLSLHDALPISHRARGVQEREVAPVVHPLRDRHRPPRSLGDQILELEDPVDRKSTRLNSSHANISYAVFCLKKKKKYLHPSHIVPLIFLNIISI